MLCAGEGGEKVHPKIQGRKRGKKWGGGCGERETGDFACGRWRWPSCGKQKARRNRERSWETGAGAGRGEREALGGGSTHLVVTGIS